MKTELNPVLERFNTAAVACLTSKTWEDWVILREALAKGLSKAQLQSRVQAFLPTLDAKLGLKEATEEDVGEEVLKKFLAFAFPPPTAKQLGEAYPTGHPIYTRATWAHLAGKLETILGYYDWLAKQLEEE